MVDLKRLKQILRNKGGCGKPCNGDLNNPDWVCGDFLESHTDEDGRAWGNNYYCKECWKSVEEKKQDE